MFEIIKTRHCLKKHYNKINCIRSLNNGGCLYGALAVWLKLKQLGFKDIHIVQITYTNGCNGSLEQNERFINGLTKIVNSGRHFGLSFNGGKSIYDSDGLVRKGRYSSSLLIPYEKTFDFAKKSLSIDNWNPCFERKTQVPRIAELLQIELKNYPIL